MDQEDTEAFGSRESTHRVWLFASTQTELLRTAYESVLQETGESWLVLKWLLACTEETLRSILSLARWGRLRDCFVLARTAFETIVNACYICAKGETAVKRALRHARQKAYRDLNREVQIGDLKLALQWSGEVDLHRDAELKSAIAEFTRRKGGEITHWTPETVEQKIVAIGARYGAEVSGDLLFAYFSIYRHASEIAHGSFFGALFSCGATEPRGAPLSKEDWQHDQRERMSLLLTMLGAATAALLSVLAHELPSLTGLVAKSRQAGAELRKEAWRGREDTA